MGWEGGTQQSGAFGSFLRTRFGRFAGPCCAWLPLLGAWRSRSRGMLREGGMGNEEEFGKKLVLYVAAGFSRGFRLFFKVTRF